MAKKLSTIKHKLTEAITQLCEVSWMFVKKPGRDFTRKRKLGFDKIVSFLLAMEGGSLTTELLKHFGCSTHVATSSAFVQQRGKIDPSAFSSLFDLFVQKTDKARDFARPHGRRTKAASWHFGKDRKEQCGKGPCNCKWLFPQWHFL